MKIIIFTIIHAGIVRMSLLTIGIRTENSLSTLNHNTITIPPHLFLFSFFLYPPNPT